MMEAEQKAKATRTRAKKYHAYSLAVVTHIALPDEAHKKYVLKLLKRGAVKQGFMKESDFAEAKAKVCTYDEAIVMTKKMKKSKKARPTAIKKGGDLQKLLEANAGDRNGVNLSSSKDKAAEKTKKIKELQQKKKPKEKKTTKTSGSRGK